MSNVTALPGVSVNFGEPDDRLVMMLEDLVEHAKTGRLRSLIGVGYTSDGGRLAVWADNHENIYEQLGSLAWLQAEYIHKHKSTLND